MYSPGLLNFFYLYNNFLRITLIIIMKQFIKNMTKSIVEFINVLSGNSNTDDNEKGETYIFSIAIDNYSSELKLNYCKRDSEYLIDVIIHKASINIKTKNIYKLYDQDATKKNIVNHFHILNKILTSKDQLIIHIAGHSDLKFKTNFFIPSDGDKKEIYSNISSAYFRKFIESTKHSTCILIFNTFDTTSVSRYTNEENNGNDDIILKTKYPLYYDLIQFLQTSEQHVSKSIWHYAKTKEIDKEGYDSMVVVEDTRELSNYLETTKSYLDKLIADGKTEKALEELINISKNNDIRIRDQADALLNYIRPKNVPIELVKPIVPSEAKGLTSNLVHQVHESGYYLIPRPDLMNESNLKPKTKVILYASADTQDQQRLRLDEEYRVINLELLRSKYRDEYELFPCLSSRITDLQRELLDKEPYIVHFSGHGTCEGICMIADDSGKSQLIKNEPLGGLFKLFSNSINCVFLNSCYSLSQSNAISQHIENVVCMSNSILDETAIKFASAFYSAIGNGRDIIFSFDFAKNSLDLFGCTDKDLPKLIKKGDV